MKDKFRALGALTVALIVAVSAVAAPRDRYRSNVEQYAKTMFSAYRDYVTVRVKSVQCDTDRRTYKVTFTDGIAGIPVRTDTIAKLRHGVDSIISPDYPGYRITFYANKTKLDNLIPNYYLPESDRVADKLPKHGKKPVPFVMNADLPYKVTAGLQNRKIALWHSHGLMYIPEMDGWDWQRAKVMTTVEDKFTMSFVLPYLLPMLERAGANVMLPRERDLQRNEMVVDNDKSAYLRGVYSESGDESLFRSGGSSGFAYKRAFYNPEQNPFREGTFRICETERDSSAVMRWTPDVPEDGWYWVSVAYVTTPQSVSDAHYTVRHDAGTTHFTVNQRMGGGTWIYLGQFYFRKGAGAESASVELSNRSSRNGVVTADAVRFGGGMGNVASRRDSLSLYQTSGVARCWEGARYWLPWAGVPYEVFSLFEGENDRKDDFTCRPRWVNWLNYGSYNIPDSIGPKIPVDLAFAFHSDAGINDTAVIGTLAIYTEKYDRRTTKFPSGQNRTTLRDFADIVQTQVVDDVRGAVGAQWTRRDLRNSNYYESREPNVPSMILELLSHQNLNDMAYGLDPRFKFVVSRAVYKGIGRYITSQYGLDFTVAPLPVSSFAIDVEYNSFLLSWKPTVDSLEPTAEPTGYVVYTRYDGGGWDNGVRVRQPSYSVPIVRDRHVSFKVVAVNGGGASLDSEILSACIVSGSDRKVLVVNGFERVCGPQYVKCDGYEGFVDSLDRGVSDGADLQYIGAQCDFDPKSPYVNDLCAGWGQSYTDRQFAPSAGNTHDFPLVHGKAIAASGCSYVSASVKALENRQVDLVHYDAIDLILGEQRTTPKLLGRGCDFKTFSVYLQTALSDYLESGGSLFVSGAYVLSDSWLGVESTEEERGFVSDAFHAGFDTVRRYDDGVVSGVRGGFDGSYRFAVQLNDSVYAAEQVDCIEPLDSAVPLLRYSDGKCAAVGYVGNKNRVVVCGFPFETIVDSSERRRFMGQVVDFVFQKVVNQKLFKQKKQDKRRLFIRKHGKN